MALALVLASPQNTWAHEFWIEAESFRVGMGEDIVASLKVGDKWSGAQFPYLSDRFIAFQRHIGAASETIAGSEGDIPAIVYAPQRSGLHVITYHSTADSLTYDDWQTFIEYVEYEGNEWALARHQQRGLPEKGFIEKYTRCAKGLIQVGPPDEADGDIIVGMPLEFLALKNPYAAGQTSLEVQLLWQGKPLGNVQIAVFRKGESENIVRQTTRTGKDGKAKIDVGEAGDYLLNAVQMTEVADDSGAVWESHWASLTFRISPGG